MTAIKFQGHVKALELGTQPGDIRVTIQGEMAVNEGCDLVLNVRNFVIPDYVPGQAVEITVTPLEPKADSGMI